MLIRTILIGAALFLQAFTSSLLAQAMVTESGGSIMLFRNESESDLLKKSKRGFYVGPHMLGEEITQKLDEFEKRYVYYKETQPPYPTLEKMVLKPKIYNAVKKMEKYYRKGALKSKIPLMEAQEKLTKVLDIGIKLMNYNTPVVEQYLASKHKEEEIEAYLLNLKFNN